MTQDTAQNMRKTKREDESETHSRKESKEKSKEKSSMQEESRRRRRSRGGGGGVEDTQEKEEDDNATKHGSKSAIPHLNPITAPPQPSIALEFRSHTEEAPETAPVSDLHRSSTFASRKKQGCTERI